MTMGQMWEQLIGKLAALRGDQRDGTPSWGQCGLPFTCIDDMRRACDQLHAEGYPRMGRVGWRFRPS